MTIHMIVGIVILVLVVLIALYIISVYNRLKTFAVKIENSFADLDTQLKRRFDLIPNLINTAKGYMKHESEVFEKVTALREGYANAGTVAEKQEINAQLTEAIKGINVQLEAYPELKANEQMNGLMVELSNTEDKIAYARQFYNKVVAAYNVILEVFPSNIVAGLFGFDKKEMFKVDSEEERQNVKVEF